MSCPCGNTIEFEQCCDIFISGKCTPDTAEKLMRSRYSAFVKKEHDYILKTHDPDTRNEVSMDQIKDWSNNSIWHGLEVVESKAGQVTDEEGIVEFIATYSVDGQECNHREISSFVKKSNEWYFHEGKVLGGTQTRSAPKIGRNDPCLCGSGKKYKRCCLK